MSKTTGVGFVGLGTMGSSMPAGCLPPATPSTATNRTARKPRHSIERGLQWRDTPREVAAAADIVFTSSPMTTCSRP